MTEAEIEELSFALCEATVCGIEFDEHRRIFATTLAVLWLPDEGPEPDDLRLQFCFLPVSRLALSLREGHWNDPDAALTRLSLGEVPGLIDAFGGNLYGNRFFDVHEAELELWGDRISLDWRSPSEGVFKHSFRLFQEASQRHLDLLVWFDELRIFRPDYEEVSVDWVVEGARRWWSAWNDDDPRTRGHGIVRLANE